jgi:hypothetical protein
MCQAQIKYWGYCEQDSNLFIVKERRFKVGVVFKIATKKYLGINLIKEVKDHYSKNYNTLKWGTSGSHL